MKSVKNKTTNPIVTILGALFGIGLTLSLLIPSLARSSSSQEAID